MASVSFDDKGICAGADPERLFRLMRFATVHGVFRISRASRRQQGPATTLFANNALSACLREDHPNSQKHLVSSFSCDSGIIV